MSTAAVSRSRLHIWAFTLKPVMRQDVPMPAGANIVAVGSGPDRSVLYAYATVDPLSPCVLRRITTLSPGDEVPDGSGEFLLAVRDADKTQLLFDGGEVAA